MLSSKRIRTFLVAGLIVVLPTVVSIYVLLFMFNVLDSWFRSLAHFLLPNAGWSFTGVGAIISISTIILVGWLTSSILGRRVISFSDWLFLRVPLVHPIYKAVKQIMDAFMQPGNGAFQQVVLVQYPRQGVWAVGFLTGRMKGEIERRMGQELLAVFMPTTPNPATGHLILVPKEEIVFLDMPIEVGIKLLISGGVVTPPEE